MGSTLATLPVDKCRQRTQSFENIAAELAVVDHDVEAVLDRSHQLQNGKRVKFWQATK